MDAGVAKSLVGLMEHVIAPGGTGVHAAVVGFRVSGKTGTASWDLPGGGEGTYASFVGVVPADRPRFVILLGFEGPRQGGYGGTVAAPAFARVATRVLGGGT